MVRGQWANLGFLMATESQDLGLTSHPKDGKMCLTGKLCTYGFNFINVNNCIN